MICVPEWDLIMLWIEPSKYNLVRFSIKWGEKRKEREGGREVGMLLPKAETCIA